MCTDILTVQISYYILLILFGDFDIERLNKSELKYKRIRLMAHRLDFRLYVFSKLLIIKGEYRFLRFNIDFIRYLFTSYALNTIYL